MSQPPLTYLISNGSTKSDNFALLLRLAEAATKARISYLQIREKHLAGRELFELTRRVKLITASSETKLLVNDRLDIAIAARADGVHLTENSVSADVIRQAVGQSLVVGVSTHTIGGVKSALGADADFAVFGPVYVTPSKAGVSEATGTGLLSDAVTAAGPMPVLALGGISLGNFAECLSAGAAGIAGIRLFGEVEGLSSVAAKIRAWR